MQQAPVSCRGLAVSRDMYNRGRLRVTLPPPPPLLDLYLPHLCLRWLVVLLLATDAFRGGEGMVV